MLKIIKVYYFLTKPGIVYGNAITAAAGFFFASKQQINLPLFLSMIAGLSLIVAGSCAFNNYIDRDIDREMERTKKRAIPAGKISGIHALIFAGILMLSGAVILLVYTNILALSIALVGAFVYIFLYTLAKRNSVYGTLVGSISGAVPPVVGYTAVSNNFNLAALLLFCVLVLWQMPHFYAIAIYRINDYKKALLPILPIKSGIKKTKIQIFIYIIACTMAIDAFSLLKYTGLVFFNVMSFICLVWLFYAFKGFKTNDNVSWVKQIFHFSLIVIILFSIMISVNSIFLLP